jgi:NAD(P)-dependent dehydrogenase (short-subunit alcohol dehydrogenase family)
MAKPGETWLVTGASKGIGLQYITQVLAAGAKAVAAVRSPKTSKDLQDLQLQYPEALTIVAMDTGVFPSVKAAAKEVELAHPEGIDFLIANAGVGTIRNDINTPNLEL